MIRYFLMVVIGIAKSVNSPAREKMCTCQYTYVHNFFFLMIIIIFKTPKWSTKLESIVPREFVIQRKNIFLGPGHLIPLKVTFISSVVYIVFIEYCIIMHIFQQLVFTQKN